MVSAVKSLKKIVKKIKPVSPRFFQVGASCYHGFRYAKVFIKTLFHLSPALPPPKVQLNIPPDRIEFVNFDENEKKLAAVYSSGKEMSAVKGGDWDLRKTKIESLPIFQAISAYLLHGQDIRSTDYYAGAAPTQQLVTEGAWHRIYEENAKEQIDRIDALSQSIKRNGYKSQIDLDSGKPFDEIAVRISRTGEFLLENSIHRLVIARVLNIRSVPVIVTMRHSKWLQIRQDFQRFAKLREGGKLYGKLTHPDLEDIPYKYESDDRVKIIEPHLVESVGAALDLGADLGIFSQMLSQLGYNCFAVERDAELARYTKILSKIERKPFNLIIGDIISPDVVAQIHSMKYEVVLGLNIFHHFLKKKDTFEKFVFLLQGLEMESMIFQAHDRSESQMQDAFLNPGPDEFAELIVQHSCLNNVKYIGTAVDSRKLFLLSK